LTLSVVGCAKKEGSAEPSTVATAPASPVAAPEATGEGTAAAPAATPAAPSVDTPAGDIEVGRPAPKFDVTASDGKRLDLAALRGKPVVLYFYPKDETPGCTKQACALRDAWNDLQKTGVVLVGVSGDSDESHKKFAANHKLPFHLVSDPNGDLAKAYGVPFRAGFAARQTIVIGPDGNVAKIYRDVDVGQHADNIRGDLAALASKR
jgi:peroxiredoxin Q/BCP